MPQPVTLEMAAEVVAAFVSNNPLPRGELPALIQTIHDTLAGLFAQGCSVLSHMEHLEDFFDIQGGAPAGVADILASREIGRAHV